MKRLRLLLLVLTLIAAGFVFYYRRTNTIRVETVWLQSRVTGRLLPYNVILPRGYGPFHRARYPVLYLLHGHGGDYSSWIANTNLTTYMNELNLIVVMPEGQDGWYTDSATVPANKFETFIVNEMIPDVESRFRVIPGRSGRAIAGYSMGGYGALKFGLKYPQLLIFAGSMSGAFDASRRTDNASIMQTFGPLNSPVRDANDLTKIATEVRPSSLPRLYFDCGTDDPWLAANRELHTDFQRLGIEHVYREQPGNHDWGYWDRRIRELLPVAAAAMSAGHAIH